MPWGWMGFGGRWWTRGYGFVSVQLMGVGGCGEMEMLWMGEGVGGWQRGIDLVVVCKSIDRLVVVLGMFGVGRKTDWIRRGQGTRMIRDFLGTFSNELCF